MKEDCYFLDEWCDMGSTAYICKLKQFGNEAGCHECNDNYVSKEEAANIIKQYIKERNSK